MENPENDLYRVFPLLMSSKDPTVLHKAMERFFTPDVSFRHPLSVVKSGPNSRQTLFGVYEWYRIISPGTVAIIDELVYDREKNIVYMDVSQTFHLRLIPVPVRSSRLLIRLRLVERDNHFYIKEQEDFFHPDDLMNCLFPPLSPVVAFFLQLIAIAALLSSKIYSRLNAIWLALFRISDVGASPGRPGDNHVNEARRNTQYGQ